MEIPLVYSDYFQSYLDLVPKEYNLLESLEISLHETIHFVQDIPMYAFDYRYAPGKWTIKEIVQHLIDCERVYSYRALSIARKDPQTLLGFDENLFANTVSNQASTRPLKGLLEEYSMARHSTIQMFKSFDQEALSQVGSASVFNYNVAAIGWILIGHEKHHLEVFKVRYL